MILIFYGKSAFNFNLQEGLIGYDVNEGLKGINFWINLVKLFQ